MSQDIFFIISFLIISEIFHGMSSISLDTYAKYKNKKLYILGPFRYIFFRCLRKQKYIKGKTSNIVKEYCNSIGKVSFWYQIANWIYMFVMVVLLIILPPKFRIHLVLVAVAYFILTFFILLIVSIVEFIFAVKLQIVDENEE